jgi:uncharacterized protein with HEPN domain
MAADAIAEFTYAQNLESFEANLMLRSAVVHQLTVKSDSETSPAPALN